jgi:hypothetical protein
MALWDELFLLKSCNKKPFFQRDLAQDIPKFANLLATATQDKLVQIQETIQSDYVLAEVYFQTLNVVNIIQSPLLDVRTIN